MKEHTNIQTGIDDNGVQWTFCYDCNKVVAEYTDEYLQANKKQELLLVNMSVGERETFGMGEY